MAVRSFWSLSLRPLLARARVVLLVAPMLFAAAPATAAGPNGARDLPLRSPGQAIQRVDPGTVQRADASRAKVDVMVVYANSSGTVDPRLANLAGIRKQLQTLGFTGADVLSTHSDQLGPNQSTTVTIQGNRKLEITMISFDDSAARVRMEMFLGAEKKWDTTTNSPRGRPILSGGAPHQQGKLMFVVTVP